jgi:hypothetical protein
LPGSVSLRTVASSSAATWGLAIAVAHEQSLVLGAVVGSVARHSWCARRDGRSSRTIAVGGRGVRMPRISRCSGRLRRKRI